MQMAIIRSLLDKICSWLVWLTTSMEAIKEQLVSILTSCLTLFSVISKCQNGSLKFEFGTLKFLLLLLLVVVRVVDTLHKGFTVN